MTVTTTALPRSPASRPNGYDLPGPPTPDAEHGGARPRVPAETPGTAAGGNRTSQPGTRVSARTQGGAFPQKRGAGVPAETPGDVGGRKSSGRSASGRPTV